MLEVGQAAETVRRFETGDLAQFAELAGTAAPETVPEPLIAALFSYLLGVHLPGPGTNYLKQEMAFVGAAPVGEDLTARVEVTRLRPDKHLVDLWATCHTAAGDLICEGRSLVLVDDAQA